MFELLILTVGVISLLGIPWILAQPIENEESEPKSKRIAPLLLVVAYALSELVPSQFVTVTPAVDLAVGVVTMTLVGLGIYLLFVR